MRWLALSDVRAHASLSLTSAVRRADPPEESRLRLQRGAVNMTDRPPAGATEPAVLLQPPGVKPRRWSREKSWPGKIRKSGGFPCLCVCLSLSLSCSLPFSLSLSLSILTQSCPRTLTMWFNSSRSRHQPTAG